MEAYAGSRAEQEPRRFTVGGRTVEIIAVARQSRTPGHDYVQVMGDDVVTYLLQYDHAGDYWECAEQRAIP